MGFAGSTIAFTTAESKLLASVTSWQWREPIKPTFSHQNNRSGGAHDLLGRIAVF